MPKDEKMRIAKQHRGDSFVLYNMTDDTMWSRGGVMTQKLQNAMVYDYEAIANRSLKVINNPTLTVIHIGELYQMEDGKTKHKDNIDPFYIRMYQRQTKE